jgi:hypothetical protein
MIKAIEQLRNWEHSIQQRNKSLKRQNEALYKLRKIETETKISNLKLRKELLWNNAQEFLKQFIQETTTLRLQPNKKYSMIFTDNPLTKFEIIKNIPLKDQLDTTIEYLTDYNEVSDLMNEHFPTNNLYELIDNYNLYFKGNPVDLELSYNDIVGEPKNNEHMDYAWFSLVKKNQLIIEEEPIEIPQRNLTIKSPKVVEEDEYSSDEEEQEEKENDEICPIISTFISIFMLVIIFIWINFKIVVSI